MRTLLTLFIAILITSCTTTVKSSQKHFTGNAYVRVLKTNYSVGNIFLEQTCDTSFTSAGYLNHEVDTIELPLIFNPDLPIGKQDKIFFNDKWYTECATIFNTDTISTYHFWVLIQNIDNCPSCKEP